MKHVKKRKNVDVITIISG